MVQAGAEADRVIPALNKADAGHMDFGPPAASPLFATLPARSEALLHRMPLSTSFSGQKRELSRITLLLWPDLTHKSCSHRFVARHGNGL